MKRPPFTPHQNTSGLVELAARAEGKPAPLWEEYRHEMGRHYDLSAEDVECLGQLAKLHLTGETRCGGPLHLFQGHRELMERYAHDPARLANNDMIRRPRINGTPKESVYHRSYWDLTPTAREVLSEAYAFTGAGVGDLNEGIVHSLGVHYLAEFLERNPAYAGRAAQQNWEFEVKTYAEYRGKTYDLLFFLDDDLITAAEVETSAHDHVDIKADAQKLAGLECPQKLWVCPTRRVAVAVANTLYQTGYLDFDRTAPETLPMVGNNGSNLRSRVQSRSPPSAQAAITDILTYRIIADWLKEQEPTLFYGGQHAQCSD